MVGIYQDHMQLPVPEGAEGQGRYLGLTQLPNRYVAMCHFSDYLISSILSSPCISLETLAHIASPALPYHLRQSPNSGERAVQPP